MGEPFSAARLLAQWRGSRGPMLPLSIDPGCSETFLDREAGVVCKLFEVDAAHVARGEVEVLRTAHAHGLPVPRVRSEFTVRGRVGITLEHLMGAPLAAMDSDLGAENRRAAWRSAGRLLASLHSIPTDTPSTQWVHGRPDGRAFLVARRPGRNSVSGFVGFDRGGQGDAADDLAHLALEALVRSYPLPVIIDGYQSVRRIDDLCAARVAHHLADRVAMLHPSVAARVERAMVDGAVREALRSGADRRRDDLLAG